VLLLLAATPVLLFGLGNLWLATPPGRGWIAKRIERAVGLQVETGPGSWAPWSGFVLRDVVLRLPADAGLADGAVDVLRVERIVVQPRWDRMLRGHATPGRIEIVRPDANIPVELLVALAGRRGGEGPPPPSVEPPALAGEPGNEKSPIASPAGVENPPARAGEAAGDRADAPQIGKHPEESPTSWLIVRGGRLRIGMGGARDTGLVLDGIDAEIPVRGKAATGGVKIAECSAGGNSIGNLDMPLSWEAPRLVVERWQPDMGGIRPSVSLQVVLRGDIPFMVACAVPERAVEIGGKAQEGRRIAARRFVGIARLAGYARAPSSWQGETAVDAWDVRVAGLFGRNLEFDRCLLRAVLRSSVVRVNDARAVGEQFSVLGNGLIFADGHLTALARIVLPEDAARAAAEEMARAAGLEKFGFQPLETPDRSVYIFSSSTVSSRW